jgi:hypothetical protein
MYNFYRKEGTREEGKLSRVILRIEKPGGMAQVAKHLATTRP